MGAHNCLENLSRMAQIASAMPSTSSPAAPTISPSAILPRPKIPAPSFLLNSTPGIDLSGLHISPVSLANLSQLAQWNWLNGEMKKQFPPVPKSGAVAEVWKARLSSLTRSLEASLPKLSAAESLRLHSLLTLKSAAGALGPLGIDIFSTAGAAKLASLIRRLREAGHLNMLQLPGLPTSSMQLALALSGLGDLLLQMPRTGAGGVLSVGGLPAPGAGLSSSGLEGLLVLLRSPGGQGLLPDASQVGQWMQSLAALRLKSPTGGFSLPSLKGSQGKGIDPLTAFEASGCCAVLKGFPELSACAAGAAKLDALARATAASQQVFKVDLRAPDAGAKLNSAIQRAEADADIALRSHAANAHAANMTTLQQISQFVSAVAQARSLKVLAPNMHH